LTTATPNLDRTRSGLDWLNFFVADVQTGVGPFVAIYLAKNGWNEQLVGIALTVGGCAGIMAQTPVGAWVDRTHFKRALIAGGVVAVSVGALLIAGAPRLAPVLLALSLIGVGSSVFIPAICAISLGVVGHRLFDGRQGRNQTFNSAGNVVAAVTMGLIGYGYSDRAIFWCVVAFAIPALWALRRIAPDQIDYERARGARSATSADTAGAVARMSDLLKDRALVVFLICSVAFHFANAAMLPLLGELLAQGRGRASMPFMSACIITTQVVVTLIASWSGTQAGRWGRKPLLMIAFAVLPIRAVLYTLTSDPLWLVAIQVLDGIGAGIFGVVSVLVIADLTRGTGRFNLALGAITTAVAIGAALSQGIAGGLVHHFGFRAGFLFLGAVALAALLLLWLFAPETGRPQSAPLTPVASAASTPTRVRRRPR
jgi:predicted MFS family arabinose efflux permease